MLKTLVQTIKTLTARYVVICDDGAGCIGYHYCHVWQAALEWVACYGQQMGIVCVHRRTMRGFELCAMRTV